MQTEYLKLVRANSVFIDSYEGLTIDTHGLLAKIKVTSGSLEINIPSEKSYFDDTFGTYTIKPNEEISFCGCVNFKSGIPSGSFAEILFYDKI